jgi:hypothetical protein
MTFWKMKPQLINNDAGIPQLSEKDFGDLTKRILNAATNNWQQELPVWDSVSATIRALATQIVILGERDGVDFADLLTLCKEALADEAIRITAERRELGYDNSQMIGAK